MTKEKLNPTKEYEGIPITALIWDLDGLLIDSEPVWSEADIEFLGIPREEYFANIKRLVQGTGQVECINIFKQKCGLKGDTEELIKRRRDLVYMRMLKPGGVDLMEGAGDLILQANRNFPLVIATSGHSTGITAEILENLGIRGYFQELISGDDIIKGKPAPDIYLAAAKKINARSSSCLVFEDAISGVLSANSAGMPVVGVNKDKTLREELRAAGADWVVASLSEIEI